MIIFHSELCHKRGWFPEGPPKIISGEGGCFFSVTWRATSIGNKNGKEHMETWITGVEKQCQIGRFPKSWISRSSHGFHDLIVSWLGGFQIGHPFFFGTPPYSICGYDMLRLWMNCRLPLSMSHYPAVPLSCSPCLKAGFRRWNNRLSGWTRRRLARERKRCFSSSSEDGSRKR